MWTALAGSGDAGSRKGPAESPLPSKSEAASGRDIKSTRTLTDPGPVDHMFRGTGYAGDDGARGGGVCWHCPREKSMNETSDATEGKKAKGTNLCVYFCPSKNIKLITDEYNI